MKHSSLVTSIIGIAMTCVIAMPVFAESAPVFDADSLSQQFDNSFESNAELPPPPPPEQDGAYVPNPTPNQPSSPLKAPPNMYMPQSPSSSSPEQRLRQIEQQINNMQSSGFAAHLDSLQDQVQTLRGQIEQLNHQLEQLTHQFQQVENQQKTLFSDLDKRLNQQTTALKQVATAQPAPTNATQAADNSDNQAINKTRKLPPKRLAKGKTPVMDDDQDTGDAGSTPAKASGDQPNVAEEQQIYQTAYKFIKAKKYNDAVNALQGMLQKYPGGQFAANAHYWLGELYGLMGKNDQALQEFSSVVRNHPESPRVSDAQYKVGLIYASQSKWVDARTAFKKVINRYPGTASARLATDQLKQIERTGN